MKLVLVSGLSGSGKSVALKALEDSGFFAIDNLPATLIPAVIAEKMRTSETGAKLAISVDVRARDTIAALPQVVATLRAKGDDCRVLFLDASSDALAHRFSETRRPHPLADRFSGGIAECIAEERRLLEEVAALGHRMDTSIANPNALRGWIRDWLRLDQTKLALTFQSFGFKRGLPIDADFVFDVRFLPNPFYDPKLRPLTGMDAEVRKFLEGDLNVVHLVDDIASFLLRWLPAFSVENRAALNVAIGCTGGQHRSVFIAGELANRFGPDQQVLVRHRDLL